MSDSSNSASDEDFSDSESHTDPGVGHFYIQLEAEFTNLVDALLAASLLYSIGTITYVQLAQTFVDLLTQNGVIPGHSGEDEDNVDELGQLLTDL